MHDAIFFNVLFCIYISNVNVRVLIITIFCIYISNVNVRVLIITIFCLLSYFLCTHLPHIVVVENVLAVSKDTFNVSICFNSCILFIHIYISMFAPPSNVYYFYCQPNLQACVCYAQLSYCTGSKFKVYWLTLLCRRYYILCYCWLLYYY